MSNRTFRTYNRYFVAVIYPDDKNYNRYIDNIMKYYTEVTYILHDKDTDENGELKKPHTHILFKVGKNPRNIKSIAEESEIPIQYIEGCNKDNMLLYFIHYKKENKHRYSINEVKGELRNYMTKLLQDNKSDEEIMSNILLLIETQKIGNIKDLTHYLIKNQSLQILRKYGYIITNMLKKE